MDFKEEAIKILKDMDLEPEEFKEGLEIIAYAIKAEN